MELFGTICIGLCIAWAVVKAVHVWDGRQADRIRSARLTAARSAVEHSPEN